MLPGTKTQDLSLYGLEGRRNYLNAAERSRALAVMAALEQKQALFALVLAWTGARVSEVVAPTPASFQIESSIVAFQTLKRRKHVVREVPAPPELMAALEKHFGLSAMQRDPQAADQRLWPWSRVTAWRYIKRVMRVAHVVGRQAYPRGLRHAFGVGTLRAGPPLNLARRRLGHSRISTTAIYAAACGPEEIEFSKRFWRFVAADLAPMTFKN
jgi:integrase